MYYRHKKQVIKVKHELPPTASKVMILHKIPVVYQKTEIV